MRSNRDSNRSAYVGSTGSDRSRNSARRRLDNFSKCVKFPLTVIMESAEEESPEELSSRKPQNCRFKKFHSGANGANIDYDSDENIFEETSCSEISDFSYYDKSPKDSPLNFNFCNSFSSKMQPLQGFDGSLSKNATPHTAPGIAGKRKSWLTVTKYVAPTSKQENKIFSVDANCDFRTNESISSYQLGMTKRKKKLKKGSTFSSGRDKKAN